MSKKKYNELGQYYENIENDLKKSKKEVADLKHQLAIKNALKETSLDDIPTTSINFLSYKADFGKILSTSTSKHTFTFTNSGVEPLVITNVKGSCGCTVPQWTKEPIAPGETGEIKIVFKPKGQSGNQTKQITVSANTKPKNTILQIKADVQNTEKSQD